MRREIVDRQFGGDKTIVIIVTIMALFGLVMVASASVAIAQSQYGMPYYYLLRQLIYLTLG